MEGLLAVAVQGVDSRGRWNAFEVEAEERVGVEVVECCPRSVPIVGKFGVRSVAGEAKVFPLGDVGGGNVLELLIGSAKTRE